MKDLRKELNEIMIELDIVQKVWYSNDENKVFKKLAKETQPLPDGVLESDAPYTYYRYVKTDLSENEIKELLLFRQTLYLKSIKNSMIFFVVLTILPIIITFVLFTQR